MILLKMFHVKHCKQFNLHIIYNLFVSIYRYNFILHRLCIEETVHIRMVLIRNVHIRKCIYKTLYFREWLDDW